LNVISLGLIKVHLFSPFIVMLFSSDTASEEITGAHIFCLVKFNQADKNQKDLIMFLIQIIIRDDLWKCFVLFALLWSTFFCTCSNQQSSSYVLFMITINEHFPFCFLIICNTTDFPILCNMFQCSDWGKIEI
jgi:hypothetical protein